MLTAGLFATRPPQRFRSTAAGKPGCPQFSQPVEVARFSYDEKHEVVHSDVALKEYVEPPIGCDLNDGYPLQYIERDPGVPDRLDGLLASLVELHRTDPAAFLAINVDVVCYRGVMTKIFCTPYEDSEPYAFGVTLHKGTLYIEDRETEHKRMSEERRSDRQRRMCYWGYRFEAYSTRNRTSDTSSEALPTPISENTCTPVVNTNVQYGSVMRTRIGPHRLLLCAEVDCILGSAPRTDLTSTSRYVELKTSKVVTSARDRDVFERYKLKKFWAQSFLAGVPLIVVGWRNDAGRVVGVERLDTMRIPRMVRQGTGAWDANVCMNFAVEMLSWLREIVTRECTKADDGVAKVCVVVYEPPRWEVKLHSVEQGRTFLLPSFVDI